MVITKNSVFAFADDMDILNETLFFEVPFEIYDCLAGKFVDIPPSACWRHPSPMNPFFLIKDSRIKDSDCPELQKLTNKLQGVTEAYLADLPRIRASSPLPPSSPPPSDDLVVLVEKAVQATDVPDAVKRKRSDSRANLDAPLVKAARKTTFQVNLHIHCGRDSPRSIMGSGSAEDPIVI